MRRLLVSMTMLSLFGGAAAEEPWQRNDLGAQVARVVLGEAGAVIVPCPDNAPPPELLRSICATTDYEFSSFRTLWDANMKHREGVPTNSAAAPWVKGDPTQLGGLPLRFDSGSMGADCYYRAYSVGKGKNLTGLFVIYCPLPDNEDEKEIEGGDIAILYGQPPQQ